MSTTGRISYPRGQTIEIQLIRRTGEREPVVLESMVYPLADLQLAKAKAQVLLEDPARDPKATAVRVVDRYGNELYSCPAKAAR